MREEAEVVVVSAVSNSFQIAKHSIHDRIHGVVPNSCDLVLYSKILTSGSSQWLAGAVLGLEGRFELGRRNQ